MDVDDKLMMAFIFHLGYVMHWHHSFVPKCLLVRHIMGFCSTFSSCEIMLTPDM